MLITDTMLWILQYIVNQERLTLKQTETFGTQIVNKPQKIMFVTII
ncbi:hypothetical protein GCAAIG_02500 [Candidatus Electronema halotolerans]